MYKKEDIAMPPIVTSEDPKRKHAIDIFAAAYDKRHFTEGEKHRVNMRGDELRRGIDDLLARFAAEGRMVSIASRVSRIIELDYHKASGKGMSADAYRDIWPTQVEQPPEYLSRLDTPFLVDYTIGEDSIAACNRNLHYYVRPGQCNDLVPRPVHPETGARLTRCVMWIQLTRWLNRTVEAACVQMPDDEVGLGSAEGVHLPGQCEQHLRSYAVDLCGSRYGSDNAPYVNWFDNDRPNFNTNDVRNPNPNYGSGSRGTATSPKYRARWLGVCLR